MKFKLLSLLALASLLLSGCAAPGDLALAPSDEQFIGRPTVIRGGTARNEVNAPGLDTPIHILKTVRPNYPSHLVAKNKRGMARIGFQINETGDVIDAIVIKATHEDFGKAAASAIRQWKFSPPMKNGVPTCIVLIQDFPFDLRH